MELRVSNALILLKEFLAERALALSPALPAGVWVSDLLSPAVLLNPSLSHP